MTDEKLYVLMPVHNGAKTIERAINSVFEQKNVDLDYRLCVVLNKCTDNTEEIVRNSTWSNRIDIINCNLKGIVPALNTGLQYCIGKGATLIARQDADDKWHPKKLSTQLEYINNNPEIDICGTSLKYVKPETFETTHEMAYPESHDECISWLLNGRNPIAHPSVIYRKTVITKCGGYDNTFPLAEDMFLWLRAYRNGCKFGNVNYPFVEYTFVPNPNYNPSVAIALKALTKMLVELIK